MLVQAGSVTQVYSGKGFGEVRLNGIVATQAARIEIWRIRTDRDGNVLMVNVAD